MSPNTRMRLWWDKYLTQKLNYSFKHSWKYSASKNISKSSRNIFKPLIFKQPKKYFQTNHFQTTKKIFSNNQKIFSNHSFSNNQKNIFKPLIFKDSRCLKNQKEQSKWIDTVSPQNGLNNTYTLKINSFRDTF